METEVFLDATHLPVRVRVGFSMAVTENKSSAISQLVFG
jgi:hypothetical protein